MKKSKTSMKPWWLHLYSKAKTYVFARFKIRDREVGGSNPLAPTIFLHPVNYLPSRAVTVLFHRVANLWTILCDWFI